MSTGDSSRTPLPFLRAWRTYVVLSQDELAQLAGVSKATIVQLELGRTRANPTTIGKLAHALGISRRELVYAKPPRHQEYTPQE